MAMSVCALARHITAAHVGGVLWQPLSGADGIFNKQVFTLNDDDDKTQRRSNNSSRNLRALRLRRQKKWAIARPARVKLSQNRRTRILWYFMVAVWNICVYFMLHGSTQTNSRIEEWNCPRTIYDYLAIRDVNDLSTVKYSHQSKDDMSIWRLKSMRKSHIM